MLSTFGEWLDENVILSTLKENHGKLCYLLKFIKILNKMFKRDTKKLKN